MGGYFRVFRAYLRILGERTGLFFCDLENRSRMNNVKKDKDGFFKCRRKFLQHPDMIQCYSEDIQKARLSNLERRGVITVALRGMPRCRCVRINYNVLIQLINRWLADCELQSVSGAPDKPVSGAPVKKQKEPDGSFCLQSKKEPAAADAAGGNPASPETLSSLEGRRMDLNPLHVAAKLTKSTRTTLSLFDKELANRVRELCISQGWVMARTDKRWWADQVRKLRQAQNGPDQEEIATTFAAYAAAVKAGKSKFKITDCHQFRLQWERLKDIAAKSPAPATPSAVGILQSAEQTSKFPAKADRKNLEAFAQRVLTWGRATAERLFRVKKKLLAERDGMKGKTTKYNGGAGTQYSAADSKRRAEITLLLPVVDLALVGVSGGADGFAQKYLIRVAEDIRQWKGWNGSFTPFEPDLGSKYADIYRLITEYGGTPAWNRLKEALK